MPEDNNDFTSQKRSRMLEINKEAARFYRDILMSEQGREGMDYLLNRGLSLSTIKHFGLGYAPDDWHTLHYHLKAKGFGEDEMLDAALLARNNNKLYDKFRHRVMFPIIDRRANIIAFGGRALEKDAMAKYMNSDETLVFKKRSNLFALNFAKNTKERYFILCEGYMDVISMHQAGFTNAVATLGTAITPEQALLMKQYCERVIVSYDSDEAGQKATFKAINLLADAGVETQVLKMSGAKDPDEYIKNFGADAFQSLIEKSGSAIEFELDKLKNGLNMDSAEGKAIFLKKAVPVLADIENKLDRAVYISSVAALCDVSKQNVEQGVEEQIRKMRRYSQSEQRKQLIRSPIMRDKINPEAEKYPNEAKAERGIIAYLFHSPDMLKKILSQVKEEDFPTSFNRRVFSELTSRLENGQNIDLTALGSEFSADEMGKIIGIQRENDLLPYTTDRLSDYIKTILQFKQNKSRKDVTQMSAQELLDYMDRIKKKTLGTTE